MNMRSGCVGTQRRHRAARPRFGTWAAWLPLVILAGTGVASGGTARPGTVPASRLAAEPAACPWVDSRSPVEARVAELLAHMPLTAKLALVHGADSGAYSGAVAAQPQLCIPRLTLNDGPIGVRMNGTTQLPSGTDLAATFDPDLARAYGAAIGAEDRAKGVDVDLGPTINIVRDPRWGRAFETYSEDPYLTGRIAAATVRGIQSQGTLAQVKHWAIYNQETYRNTTADDAMVSERAIHELYTAAFRTVIRTADPASVMCSYAWVNGISACQSAPLYHILRDEYGFKGFVTSDWGGTHSTVGAATNGLDLEMPGSRYFGSALAAAVADGKVPGAQIDKMAGRILAQEFRFDLFNRKLHGSPDADASTAAHRELALRVAEDGAVLLKNAHAALPLSDADRSIAVIGAGAGFDTLTHGGGSASVAGTGTVTPLAGIAARAARAGARVRYAPGPIPSGGAYPTIPAARFLAPSGRLHGLRVEYFDNATLSGAPVATDTADTVSRVWHGTPVPGIAPGHAYSVRWTGTLVPPVTGTYTLGLTAAGGGSVYVNGKPVLDDWDADAGYPAAASASKAVVSGRPVPLGRTWTARVALTANVPARIEVDYVHRPASGHPTWWMQMGSIHLSDAFVNLGWLLPDQQATIHAAAQLAARSDVAIVYANKFESEAFDEADLDLPGRQNALITAVAAANPRTIVVLNTGSAVTMPWLARVAGVIEAWYPGQESGKAIAALLYGDANPSGKLPVTFPTSLAQVPAATPAEWGGVAGEVHYNEGLDVGYRWYEARHLTPLFPFGYGLSYTTFTFSGLHVSPTLSATGTVRVRATVTNAGARAGADVVQVYLAHPAAAGEPPQELVGFDRVYLEPHASREVAFTVSAHAASIWNPQTRKWQLVPGQYQVRVGDSSQRLPLQGAFDVAN